MLTPIMQTIPASLPAGSIIAFAGQIVKPPVDPTSQAVNTTVTESYGWMLCDGSVLTIAGYGVLYNAIGNQYNTGNEGAGQFSIPDYRGYFLRMVDLNAGRDPDISQRVLANGTASSEVGSIQQDALQTHQHSYNQPQISPFASGDVSASAATSAPGTLTGTPTDDLNNPPGTVRPSTETRAKNVYVNYLIKFI